MRELFEHQIQIPRILRSFRFDRDVFASTLGLVIEALFPLLLLCLRMLDAVATVLPDKAVLFIEGSHLVDVDLVVIALGYIGLRLVHEACRVGLQVVGLGSNASVVAGLRSGSSHVDDVADAEVRESHGPMPRKAHIPRTRERTGMRTAWG